ncbi:MAG: hypothetical protein ABWX59_12835 [Microbacteriaceae bacterium]
MKHPHHRQPPKGRVLDAQLHLLDRQVLDADDVPVVTVDDIEIEGVEFDQPIGPDAAAPVIRSLLSGPVLGTRIFGGRPPASRWHRIPWSVVNEVGIVVRIGVRAEQLDLSWTERWVRDHIIGRIPGGHHDPE